MENTIQYRKVGRPKGGHLSLEEQNKAKQRHYEDVRIWKIAHPDSVKEYRKKYAIRRKAGEIEPKKHIDILQAFINDIKNVTIE
jgi:hypothetical protein